MAHSINFTTATDTDSETAAAIGPHTNGEEATAANFNRPLENLRVRTETLRTALEATQDTLATYGVKSIVGTANQVTATTVAGVATLTLPQDIGTSSDVTFATVGLVGFKSTASAGNVVRIDPATGGNAVSFEPTSVSSGVGVALSFKAGGTSDGNANGASLALEGGTGGAFAAGGGVNINSGTGFQAGAINVGTTRASEVKLGHASITVKVQGAFQLTTATSAGFLKNSGTGVVSGGNTVNLTSDVGTSWTSVTPASAVLLAPAANATPYATTIRGGTSSTTATAGDLQLSGGLNTGSGAGGTVYIDGGRAADGATGPVQINGVGYNSGVPGDVLLGTSSNGGNTVRVRGAFTLASALGVQYGGTGAATFTAGYLKASGTSAFTTTAAIPVADVTGALSTATAATTYQTIAGMSAYAPLTGPSFTAPLTVTSATRLSTGTVRIVAYTAGTTGTYDYPVLRVETAGTGTEVIQAWYNGGGASRTAYLTANGTWASSAATFNQYDKAPASYNWNNTVKNYDTTTADATVPAQNGTFVLDIDGADYSYSVGVIVHLKSAAGDYYGPFEIQSAAAAGATSISLRRMSADDTRAKKGSVTVTAGTQIPAGTLVARDYTSTIGNTRVLNLETYDPFSAHTLVVARSAGMESDAFLYKGSRYTSATTTEDVFSVSARGAVWAKNLSSAGGLTVTGVGNGLVRVSSGTFAGGATVSLSSEVSGTLLPVSGGTGKTTADITSNAGKALTAKADGTYEFVAVTAPTVTVPYDLMGGVSGKPLPGQVLLRFRAARAFTLSGTATAHKFTGATAAASGSTSAFTVSVTRSGTSTPYTVITATFSGTNLTNADVTLSNPTYREVAENDVITVTAPATQNASLADVFFTIAGTV